MSFFPPEKYLFTFYIIKFSLFRKMHKSGKLKPTLWWLKVIYLGHKVPDVKPYSDELQLVHQTELEPDNIKQNI